MVHMVHGVEIRGKGLVSSIECAVLSVKGPLFTVRGLLFRVQGLGTVNHVQGIEFTVRVQCSGLRPDLRVQAAGVLRVQASGVPSGKPFHSDEFGLVNVLP